MKKFWSILLSFTLLLTLAAPLTGEAKSRSGSSKSYKSSSNSYRSSTPSNTTPKSGTDSNTNSGTSNSTTITTPKTGTGSNSDNTNSSTSSKPKTGTGNNLNSSTTKSSATTPSNKTYVPSSYLKRESPYKTPYYKPSSKVNYSKYKNKKYYNSSSGFASTLLTAAGVYLILDSFNDDDEPIYINAETGDPLTQEELDELEVEPVEVQSDSEIEEETATPISPTASKESSNEKEEQKSGSNTWMWFVIGILVSIIGFLLFSKKKR